MSWKILWRVVLFLLYHINLMRVDQSLFGFRSEHLIETLSVAHQYAGRRTLACCTYSAPWMLLEASVTSAEAARGRAFIDPNMAGRSQGRLRSCFSVRPTYHVLGEPCHLPVLCTQPLYHNEECGDVLAQARWMPSSDCLAAILARKPPIEMQPAAGRHRRTNFGCQHANTSRTDVHVSHHAFLREERGSTADTHTADPLRWLCGCTALVVRIHCVGCADPLR